MFNKIFNSRFWFWFAVGLNSLAVILDLISFLAGQWANPINYFIFINGFALWYLFHENKDKDWFKETFLNRRRKILTEIISNMKQKSII